MNAALSLVCRVLLCLFLLAILMDFLIATTPGLNTLIVIANELLPGQLTTEGLSGRLLDHASFKRLSYTDKQVKLLLTQGTISSRGSMGTDSVSFDAASMTLNGIPLGQLNGTINKQLNVNATLRWRDTAWKIDPTHLLKSPSGTITIQGVWPDVALIAEARLSSPENTRINAHATLHADAIEGALTVDVPSIDFFKAFNDLNERVQAQGQLHATLTVKGTLQKPELTGKLCLTKGQLTLPDAALTLSPIEATLESQDKHWQANGVLTHGAKTLTLTGQGEFAPLLSGALTLHGENIDVINTPEYVIQASPDLTFTFKPGSYGLTGKIVIPQASIKPMTFSDTINLTDDAVFVSTEHERPSMNLTTNVDLSMGEAVALDVKGLHGLLNGSIHLTQQPKQPVTATGVLTLRDGRYQAYGQHLLIKDSELVFTGPNIDNPTIHIRAVRHVDQSTAAKTGSSQLFDFKSENLQNIAYGNNVNVGIDLRGRLKTPKVTLFSTPPTLSQADILSMLLLGKPVNQASKSGGQLLVSAISALNLDSSSKGAALLQQLKSKLNVDFDVQNSAPAASQTNTLKQGAALGVGKSLTKRLYLHYTIDLFQDNSNVLTLTYLLNQFFSIQVTANNIGNGVDLLYTHQGVAEQ